MTEGVVVGSVTLNGQCYNVERNSDNAEYLVVGTTVSGQCYNLFHGGCQPDNCGWTAGGVCNDQVAACTIPGAPYCVYHSVVEGDTCYDLAMAYGGGSLEDVQAWNSGVDCDNLQIGTQLCTKIDYYPGQTMCEGLKISG